MRRCIQKRTPDMHITSSELTVERFWGQNKMLKICRCRYLKNLGTWLDSTLSMNSHVNNTCSNAFYCLYNIRRIRKYLSRRSTETIIHAFVSSRVDYCNSLLYGLPAYQLNKVQRVQNAAARLIFQVNFSNSLSSIF